MWHRSPWAKASTFAELADLTARWLEGDLAVGDHPGYPSDEGEPIGPDPETAPLAGTLAALNRRGWLTITSQPGERYSSDGVQVVQHAGVEGWVVSEELRTSLTAFAREHALVLTTHRIGEPGAHGALPYGLPVTLVDDEVFTVMGVYLTDDIARAETLPDCGRRAVDAALRGYLITIIDPVPARNTLWTLLDALVERTPAPGPG